jgi:2-polyprenyl-6-hydroxyphenyl methylase/3-demethylubiquinone-9 3-methyltransferase
MKFSRKWRLAQFLEYKWWIRYLENKTPEEYLSWKKNYWRNFLSQLNIEEESLKGKRILDAGCGPAGIFTILDNSTVTAIDPLIEKYGIGLPHFDAEKYPYTRFINATIEQFHSHEPFDIIFSINAINHVSDIEKAIRMIYGNTQKGGMVVITTDVHQNPILKGIFKLIPGDMLHPQQHELSDYEELINNVGFKITQITKLKSEAIFDYVAFVATKE